MKNLEISRSRLHTLFPDHDSTVSYDLSEALSAAIEKSLLGNSLTEFEWLIIDCSCFDDISALNNMTNLKRLEVSECKPSQVESVLKLENLEDLTLSDSRVLAGTFDGAILPKLAILRLLSSDVSDLVGLNRLASLEEISLDDSIASDDVLSGLGGIPQLRSLDLYDCAISTLKPFWGSTALEVLHLDFSKISDLSSVTTFGHLKELSIGGTIVTDLAPLASLKELTRLDLSGTKPTSLEPLAGTKALQKINLSFAELPDLTPLADHDKVDYIDLSWAKSLDVVPLAASARKRRVRVVAKQLSWFQKRKLHNSNIELIEDRYK